MRHRHALPLLIPSSRRLLAAAAATLVALLLPAGAQAEENEEPLQKLPLISFLMPSLAEPTAASAEDVLTRQEIRVAPQLPGTIDLTTRPENLWDRIRNGFGMVDLSDSIVLQHQQWYQSHPDMLRRMVERSRPYLHYIVEELEARGMPTELALLPMVESSFNPMAYSRAKASGLWQFIPATGKRYKLEQDWWRDERRDVIASTNAALDYLQAIYEMHGDWHLALASYNWGEGAVKRAVEKNESRGLPGDYPNLTMPSETRHYVPKLQALKNIFGNPALVAQLGIPNIPNEPYLAMLETPKPMDVTTAARLANMSVEEFQRLNPSHNRPVIRPDSAVVLPADKLETFRTNLANHQAPLSHWQAYTVTSTERLDQIAARFDTTAAELARVNGLSEKVRLAAGSTLLVPGVANGGLISLFNESAPRQIIAPEPVARSCGKKGGKKGKAADCGAARSEMLASGGKAGTKMAEHGKGKESTKAASAQASRKDTKVATKAVPSTAAKGGKAVASTKVAPSSDKKAPAKVARSGSGKRG